MFFVLMECIVVANLLVFTRKRIFVMGEHHIHTQRDGDLRGLVVVVETLIGLVFSQDKQS